MSKERFSATKEIERSKMAVDAQRFQGRLSDFSEDTVNAIVNKGVYDKSGEPIIVWHDPATDKYIVISGHSRFEATGRLLANGQTDLKTLPVKEFLGDQDEAIDFAVLESNRGGTEEGLISDLNAYRRAVQQGRNKQFLQSIFKPETKLRKLQHLYYLNPQGRFIEHLAGDSARSFPYLERNAMWVGQLRSQLPALTDAHENEIFDYIYKDGKGLKLDKEKFFGLIDKKVNRLDFDHQKPLNLNERIATNVYTDPINEQIKELDNDIERLQKRITDRQETIVRARREGKEEFIPAFQKEISDANTVILRKIEEREKLRSEISKVERAPMQDLFSTGAAVPVEVVEEKKAVSQIDFANDVLKEALKTKEELANQIDAIRKQETETTGPDKYALFKSREPLQEKYDYAREIVLIAENGVQAVKNNGEIIALYTDKKGKQHAYIPDFRKVDTTAILFDEETILTEPTPAYIPKLNEDFIRIKGYVLDAMRIDKDSYIVSLSEHKEDSGGYIITTLDQLVLISDYYLTKAKAVNVLRAKQRTQKQEEYYNNLPEKRRELHLNQKGFYHSLPATVKKKISEEKYTALEWQEKEKLYKPFKRYGAEKLKSKLDDTHMWLSTHKMYERFVNPEATQPAPRTANNEVFAYWRNFREFLDYKIKDLKIQREDLSEIRKTALETSFGVSNTNDTLLQRYGILVKRQNGSKINPAEIEQIEKAWIETNKTFGNLKPIAEQIGLKISHTGDKYIFASRAIGVWVSSFNTIAVSNKYGDNEFKDTTAHETAHLIDNYIGKANGKRYATDDYESTAGQIAFTFRKNLNAKTNSDYINATKECFARAFQQYFAIKTRGVNATLLYSEGALRTDESYFVSNNFVSQSNFETKIAPLIETFLSEHKEIFKTAFVAPEEVKPIEAVAEVTPEPIPTTATNETEFVGASAPIHKAISAGTGFSVIVKRNVKAEEIEVGKNVVVIGTTGSFKKLIEAFNKKGLPHDDYKIVQVGKGINYQYPFDSQKYYGHTSFEETPAPSTEKAAIQQRIEALQVSYEVTEDETIKTRIEALELSIELI